MRPSHKCIILSVIVLLCSIALSATALAAHMGSRIHSDGYQSRADYEGDNGYSRDRDYDDDDRDRDDYKGTRYSYDSGYMHGYADGYDRYRYSNYRYGSYRDVKSTTYHKPVYSGYSSRYYYPRSYSTYSYSSRYANEYNLVYGYQGIQRHAIGHTNTDGSTYYVYK